MPGKKINNYQIKLYMENRQRGNNQKISAAKAGFSERSARNVEKRASQAKKTHHYWRTRSDPLKGVWEEEIVKLLEKNPKLEAKTLLEYLQEQYDGQYSDRILRTLQRRVQKWKALHGPEKEVIFRQEIPPGFQGISDFTNANELAVTINKEPLAHLIYHFRLSYSGMEYAQVVLGGESFSALSEGVQKALWSIGGVPQTHRTDSLSAAYKNLGDKAKEDFTKDYLTLCEHYGMHPTRNNKGVSHENGAIESSHGHLKSKLKQALMMRGSTDFESLMTYRNFVQSIVEKRNRSVLKAFEEEKKFLKSLPDTKTFDFTEERVKVSSCRTITIKRVVYSVPSRLIGMTMKVHLYDDRLECFIGGDFVISLNRVRNHRKNKRCINYKHVIGALCQKPGALRHYIFKEDLFPTFAFKQAWEYLKEQLDERRASIEYVNILKEAAIGDREREVNHYLEECLANGQIPKAEEVRKLFSKEKISIPCQQILEGDLAQYDCLIGGSR